jgi:hypothetical protein
MEKKGEQSRSVPPAFADRHSHQFGSGHWRASALCDCGSLASSVAVKDKPLAYSLVNHVPFIKRCESGVWGVER